MASVDELFQAVIAAPDDDAPRAAYAEAIAAAHPEQAEFIRLSLLLAKGRKTGMDPDARMHASVRAFILKDKHRSAWEAGIRPMVAGCNFFRGFVELIVLDAATFLETAPELYRRAPIRHLILTGVRPVAAALFGSPHLRRIVSLSLLRNNLGDAEVAMLAESPHLGRLTWLNLALNSVGPAGVEALAASPGLPCLGFVGLRSNPLEDPTPTHADGYDQTSPAAKALLAKYGPRDWLDARERSHWPPDLDELA